MFWPCETRTSTCRNFATISSGLYRFLAITVLLDVKDIPQVGPLQWGWISYSVNRIVGPNETITAERIKRWCASRGFPEEPLSRRHVSQAEQIGRAHV